MSSSAAAAKVVAGADDDAVEIVARDLAEFADVVVAAVARAVEDDGAIFVRQL